MTSDLHARLLDVALASVRAGKPFADVVGEVVGLASAEAPSPAWDAIAATDTVSDVAGAIPWFVRQFEERPPPDDLSWLWFGQYVVRSISPGRLDAMVAVSGGSDVPAPGWTSNRGWDAAGYVPAPGLRALLSLAASEEPDRRALVAGPVVFAYSLGLVAALLGAVSPDQILGGRPRIGVIVGVPDGDMVELGVLTADGLDRSDLHRIDRPAAEPEPESPPV